MPVSWCDNRNLLIFIFLKWLKGKMVSKREIIIAVDNRTGDNSSASTKEELSFMLILQNGAPLGPYAGPKVVPAHKATKMKVEIDDENCIGVQFMWREGNSAGIGRSVRFDRDSKMHHLPWDAVFLGFYRMSIKNNEYEEIGGFLANRNTKEIEHISED
jgi:hypothetical protein